MEGQLCPHRTWLTLRPQPDHGMGASPPLSSLLCSYLAPGSSDPAETLWKSCQEGMCPFHLSKKVTKVRVPGNTVE